MDVEEKSIINRVCSTDSVKINSPTHTILLPSPMHFAVGQERQGRQAKLQKGAKVVGSAQSPTGHRSATVDTKRITTTKHLNKTPHAPVACQKPTRTRHIAHRSTLPHPRCHSPLPSSHLLLEAQPLLPPELSTVLCSAPAFSSSPWRRRCWWPRCCSCPRPSSSPISACAGRSSRRRRCRRRSTTRAGRGRTATRSTSRGRATTPTTSSRTAPGRPTATSRRRGPWAPPATSAAPPSSSPPTQVLQAAPTPQAQVLLEHQRLRPGLGLGSEAQQGEPQAPSRRVPALAPAAWEEPAQGRTPPVGLRAPGLAAWVQQARATWTRQQPACIQGPEPERLPSSLCSSPSWHSHEVRSLEYRSGKACCRTSLI